MKNKITHLRQICLCVLLGCFTCLTAHAYSLNYFAFNQEFQDNIAKENLENMQFCLEFSTEPNFSEDRPEPYDYSSKKKLYKMLQKVSFSTETVTLYYRFSIKGYVQEGVGSFVFHYKQKAVVEFNPLAAFAKLQMISPLDREGAPIPATFRFLGKPELNPYIPCLDIESVPILPQGTVPEYEYQSFSGFLPDTISYWFPQGEKIHYFIVPGGETPFTIPNGDGSTNNDDDYRVRYNPKDLLLPYEGVIEANQENLPPLTADYAKATEIRMSAKTYDGYTIRWGEATLNVTYGDKELGPTIRPFHPYNGKPRRLNDYLNAIDGQYIRNGAYCTLYGLPGNYFVEIWNLRNTMSLNGFPARIDIKSQDTMNLEYDFTKYLTINACNKDQKYFSLANIKFKTKEPYHGNNVYVEHGNYVRLPYGYMSSGYIRHDREPNSDDVIKIWAPLGYDLVDFDGSVTGDSVYVENWDYHKNRHYTIKDETATEVTFNVPQVMVDLGAHLVVVDEYNQPDSLKTVNFRENFTRAPRDFNKMTTLTSYKSPGIYEMFMALISEEGHRYVSEPQKVVVTANKAMEVDFKLPKSVAFDASNKMENNDYWQKGYQFEFTSEEGAEPWLVYKGEGTDFYQYLYLTDNKPYEYKITGRQDMIPYLDSYQAGPSLQSVFLPFDDYKRVSLSKDIIVSDAVWYGNNGTAISFQFFEDNADQYVYAYSGEIQGEFITQTRYSTYCVPGYRLKFSVNNGVDNAWLTQQNSHVVFVRGNENVSLKGYSEAGDLSGEVELYLLHNPNAAAKDVLKVYLGRKNNDVYLIPGTYCAKDGKGNEAYFEVTADGRTMTIDFNNPPIPPTGIDDIHQESTAPVAYYDMSGRLLHAPQKGINLVRLKNGNVRKIMVK